MDKFSAEKLDNLFKEQFSDMEIPLEEDYWPGIEKGLNKLSFYKFGWKHINIYNLSTSLLVVLFSTVYLSNKKEEDIQIPSVSETEKKSTIISDSVNNTIEHYTIESKPAEVSKNKKSKPQTDKILDSVVTPVEETPLPVIITPEPPAPVVEEKPKQKQKKIIYIVQQDTIIQKDTVKVRRKKKN